MMLDLSRRVDPPSKPYLVLVEHDYYIRELYREILSSDQINLLTFSNIIPALEAIHRHKPAIIFIDVDLPSGTALKLLKQIDQEKIKTKLILLSNFEGKEAIRKYLSSQVEGVVETSRVQPDDILRIVYKILAENKN